MRKTKVVDITDEGRDKGKRFFITEMPAMQAEKWAARAFLALAHSGTELPEGAEGAGLAGIAVIGLRALSNANFGNMEPLMDEMLQCVQIVPDPNQPNFMRGLIGQDDIEELATLARLRMEVFELHTGFSLRDALSRSQAARNTMTSSVMQTSQPSSVQ